MVLSMTNILWLPLFFGFAFSSGGIYYEYSYSISAKDMDVRGVTRVYVQPDGKSRLETDVRHYRAPQTVPDLVLLADAGHQNEYMSLSGDSKSYVIRRLPDTVGHEPSVVTFTGREKVDGYDCVHARI